MTAPSRILRAMAIGDAHGAGYEYVPQAEAEGFRIEDGFRENTRYPGILAGQFTDDTMLGIAAARAMIADAAEGRVPTAASFCQAMVDLHRDHPSTGYSKPTREAMDAARSGPELARIFAGSVRSESNGAAMRSAPYGILGSPRAVMDAAGECGAATHAGEGVRAAQAVALASHYLFRGLGPRSDLDAFLERHVGPGFEKPHRARVAPKQGPMGLITVRAALAPVRDAATLSEVLERCIRIGGDVDTVAAVGMGLAVSCLEIVDDLSVRLWEGRDIVPVSGLGWNEIVLLDAELSKLAHPRVLS